MKTSPILSLGRLYPMEHYSNIKIMGEKDKGSITLSPKYGVNPSVLHCFICGKETGITLFGKLKGDTMAPHDISNPNEICDDCRKQIEAGNKFFLEVKDDTNHDNPERTGRMVCVRGEALPKVKSPINYIEHKAFDQLFSEALKDK